MPTRRSRRIASPPSESATPNAERSRSPTPAPPRKVPRGTQDSDVRKARGRQKVAQQTLEAERKRQAHRAQNDSDASRIPHAGDSDETRLLKDKLDELSGQLHAANRHIHQLQEPSSQPPEDSPTRDVLRPSNLDKVKIKDLRLCLGLNGNEHNAQWNLIRTKVRMAMFGAHLDWQLDFKLQSKKKLGKLTEAVEEENPVLCRCQRQWAAEYLIHDAFLSHRRHLRESQDPSSYRSRHRTTKRRATRTPSPGDDFDPSDAEQDTTIGVQDLKDGGNDSEMDEDENGNSKGDDNGGVDNTGGKDDDDEEDDDAEGDDNAEEDSDRAGSMSSRRAGATPSASSKNRKRKHA